MIEIKCSKAQFDRIMTNLSTCGCLSKSNGLSVCVLGKSQYTCPAINGKNPQLSCTECLRKNIVRKEDAENALDHPTEKGGVDD